MPLIEDCVFCKIIRGEIPCSQLYEDDQVLAFLDIAPFNYGHALVIPKDHHHSITTLPSDFHARIMAVASKVAVAQMRALKAEGFNLVLNNGRCAGQEVPHVHLHVIPRFVDDQPIFKAAKKKYDSTEEMLKTAESIRAKLKE
jgi:histidine triad (HIT) family protein